MSWTRAGQIAFVCGVAVLSTLNAADFSRYRGMEFGMPLAVAAKAARTRVAEVRPVHQRPALIQEMDWRPESLSPTDPLKSGILQFFNGELSRIIITYDRYKVEGMTTEDMIDELSGAYGKALRPDAKVAFPSLFGDTLAVLARWEDAAYCYDLVHSGDKSTFVMILYSKKLDGAAQAAILEAMRLDKAEAPQRERAQQEAQDAKARLALEHTRSVNKSNFRP